MIRNKKGMTLIEILVVLVISSLVMVLAGSLILNSIGYFDKTASSDVDKQVTDSMASFVREELIFASNVKVSTTMPESNESQWYSLSLNENGYLEKDDEQLYPNDYYNHKKLKIQASVYANTYRLDLKFSLMDGKDAKYTTSTTLELINVKTKILGDKVEGSEITSNTETVEISHESGNKIYYQKGTMGITDEGAIDPPSGEQEGTVADEIKCKNELNTGEWGNGEKYKVGTFVEYNGVTYRAIEHVGDSSSTPDENQKGHWKVIDRTFHERSSYEKDDVVEYPEGSKQYYICLKNNKYDWKDPVSINDKQYWVPIAKEDINKDKYNTCETEKPYVEGTVGAEIGCITDENLSKWETLNAGNTNRIEYKIGTYVEYPIGSGEYYKAIRYGCSNEYIPEGDSHFWKKIDQNWTLNTLYEYGDIVWDEKTKSFYKNLISYPNNSTSSPGSIGNHAIWATIDEEEVKKNDACRTIY